MDGCCAFQSTASKSRGGSDLVIDLISSQLRDFNCRLITDERAGRDTGASTRNKWLPGGRKSPIDESDDDSG